MYHLPPLQGYSSVGGHEGCWLLPSGHLLFCRLPGMGSHLPLPQLPMRQAEVGNTPPFLLAPLPSTSSPPAYWDYQKSAPSSDSAHYASFLRIWAQNSDILTLILQRGTSTEALPINPQTPFQNQLGYPSLQGPPEHQTEPVVVLRCQETMSSTAV